MPHSEIGANPTLDWDGLRQALVSLVAERGYRATGLELVLDRAGLDRDVFEAHFADLEECHVAVWKSLIEEFLAATGEAFAAAPDWREGMRAAAWAYCGFLQDDRVRARYMVELSIASEAVGANRDLVLDTWVELIHRGRAERPAAAAVPRVQAEAIVGAIWQRIVTTVLADRFDEFPRLIPELLYLTVLPYLGTAAAREELRRGPEDRERYTRGRR